MTGNNRDPLRIDERAYQQMGKLLDYMETEEAIPFKERCAALQIIVRLRDLITRREDDGAGAGSAVRRYATAFQKANAARGGKKNARRTPARTEPDAGDDDPAYLADLDSDAA